MPCIAIVASVLMVQAQASTPRIAVLPMHWIEKPVHVISGSDDVRFQEAPIPEVLAQAFATAIRQIGDPIADADVAQAAAASGLASAKAYGDRRALESLRMKLGVDLVIAPVIESFGWFRGRATAKLVDPSAEERKKRRSGNPSWRGSVVKPQDVTPHFEAAQESGHSASMHAIICSSSAFTRTQRAESEIVDNQLKPKTETADAQRLAKYCVEAIAKKLNAK